MSKTLYPEDVRLISVVEGVNWAIGVSDTDTVDGNEELEELMDCLELRSMDLTMNSLLRAVLKKKDCIFRCFSSATITIYFITIILTKYLPMVYGVRRSIVDVNFTNGRTEQNERTFHN
ncbi:Hypothetical protein CINCED_3A019808 [Cinara cedri]|uniref:Uncharacterized protein n=1 Tax=Cinara cedri TaxID=506608 RepID=A0A5E4N2E7_9HEMI|nr:Hypothetical protein CINCED_3A019808 [Cinara cedri]